MSEPFIAEIIMFGGNFAPREWAFCEGQLLPIASNTALFSLVGTTYGGDGRTTLGLPDTRGRAVLHAGRGPGLTDRRLGSKDGSQTNTLNLTELASHNHVAAATVPVNTGDGNVTSPVGAYLSKTAGASDRNYYRNEPNATMNAGAATATIENSTGGGTAVNNLQPFIGIYYIICLQGVYPSRS